MDVSENNGTPKWMVKIMEHPIKMDDLGGKTTIFGNIQVFNCSKTHSINHYFHHPFWGKLPYFGKQPYRTNPYWEIYHHRPDPVFHGQKIQAMNAKSDPGEEERKGVVGYGRDDIPTHQWEPKTFIFGGYDPYIGGCKTFIFHGFGVQRQLYRDYNKTFL